MKRCLSKFVKASAVGIGLTLATMAFYQVRELAAALIIFSVVFGTVGTAFLLLILIQEAALQGVAWLEGSMAHVRARHAAPSTHAHNFPGTSP